MTKPAINSVKGNPEESSLYFSSPEGETRQILHFQNPYTEEVLLFTKKVEYNFLGKGSSNQIWLLSIINIFQTSILIERSFFVVVFVFAPAPSQVFLLLSNCSLCVLWECFCLRGDMQLQSTSVCISSQPNSL